MRELNASEIEEVSGGFIPAIQGVVYGVGLLAGNTAVRTAVSWAAQGIVGGTAFAGVQRMVNGS
jgi:lactobin A/cerein 7B family class IIb bacteriocin